MSHNALARTTDFSPEERRVIETQFFPSGATATEQQYCFAVARELGLNPITREIHFVPRRQKVGDRWINKVEPMVGRDGFLAIAHKTNQFAGIETVCTIKDVPQLENGKWVIRPQLVAECTVWRKDSGKPFTAQVSYNEYCQRTADGNPTKFWSEKPETMLKKVAESQALRKAFNIHGVYAPEELGAGYEDDGGGIVTPVFEAEVSHGRDESRLSVVPRIPPRPVPPPQEETRGPATPEPSSMADSPQHDAKIDEIVALLEGKRIPHEIDMEGGWISAKSYNERQLLKDAGFRWDAEARAWVLTFEPVPF